jgi:hypothetical protein
MMFENMKEKSKYLTSNNNNTNIFRVTSLNDKILNKISIKKEINDNGNSFSVTNSQNDIERVLFGEDSTYFIENIKNVKLRPINLKKSNNVTFFALPSANNYPKSNYLNFNSSQRYNKIIESDRNNLFEKSDDRNLNGILKNKNNFIPCFSRFWSELQQLKNKDPSKLKSNHLSFTYFS